MRRTPVRFRSKLQGKPAELYGTTGWGLVAHLAGRPAGIGVSGPGSGPNLRRRSPKGQLTSTFLGDLVAVAADTAVVLYPPRAASPSIRSIPIAGDARAVLFSPSGHRLYVARAAAPLLVLDRFEGTRLHEIELPGPARELRGDIYGSWLLVRPEKGDSVWVIDVGTGKYLGGHRRSLERRPPRRRAAPHPAGAARNRSRGLDLAATGFTQAGRVEGGAADLLVAARLASGERDRDSHSRPIHRPLASADTGPGRPNGLSPGEQLAEPDLGQRALREAPSRRSSRFRADPQALSRTPTGSC